MHSHFATMNFLHSDSYYKSVCFSHMTLYFATIVLNINCDNHKQNEKKTTKQLKYVRGQVEDQCLDFL